MSLLITFNGANYIIPETNEVGWGSNLDAYFVAIAAGCLQKTGGSFTLSAETDFGASFGLKALYYKSRASNVGTTGAIRLANAETGIVWRNALNNADLPLTVNSSNQLSFNGVPLAGAGVLTANRAVVTDGSGNVTSATTTSTEIGYVNGVTSAIQTQFTGKKSIATGNAFKWETTDTSGNLQETTVTASRAVASDSNGLPVASTTTAAELNFVAGVTSAIQTQLNTKATDSLVVHLAGTETITGLKTFSDVIKTSNGSAGAPAIVPSADTATGIRFLRVPHAVDIIADGISLASFSNNGARFSQVLGESGVAIELGTTIHLTGSDVTLATSSTGLVLTDNSTNTVKLKATNSTTSYTLSFPTTAGTNGFVLTTDGSGNTSWTAAGSGTVGSGTAGNLTLYPSSSNSVTDTYVQNTKNITVNIATQAARSANLVYTLPNPGNAITAANIILSEGAQTIVGQTSFSTSILGWAGTGVTQIAYSFTGDTDSGLAWIGADNIALAVGGVAYANLTTTNLSLATSLLTITGSSSANIVIEGTTNQLQLGGFGGARFYTITAPQPATSSRTLTIPDPGANANFVLSEGTATINGAKTFGNDLTISRSASGGTVLETINNTSNTATSIAALALQVGGTSAGDAVISFTVPATFVWSMGLDNSDSDSFVISQATTLGTTNALRISGTTNGVAISGTNTNDSGAAGFVGEYVESVAGVTNAPTSTQFGDLTSISLTAGDWDVNVTSYWDSNGSTFTALTTGVSTTTGNSATGLVLGSSRADFNHASSSTTVTEFSQAISPIRFSLSGTTTVYLKFKAVYSAGTPQAYGRISARRAR